MEENKTAAQSRVFPPEKTVKINPQRDLGQWLEVLWDGRSSSQETVGRLKIALLLLNEQQTLRGALERVPQLPSGEKARIERRIPEIDAMLSRGDYFSGSLAVLKALMASTGELEMVRHELKKGEYIRPDQHENLEEVIVLLSGECQVGVGNREREYRLNGKAEIIEVPKGMKHYLLATADVSYLVVKRLVVKR